MGFSIRSDRGKQGLRTTAAVWWQSTSLAHLAAPGSAQDLGCCRAGPVRAAELVAAPLPGTGSSGAGFSRQCARVFSQKICAATLPALAAANK